MASDDTPRGRRTTTPRTGRTQADPNATDDAPKPRTRALTTRPARLPQDQRTQGAPPDMTERGLPGTKILAGLVFEEDNPDLQGQKGLSTYKDMGWDPTVRALLQAYTLPIRGSRWFMEPASDDPKDVDMADFAHHNLWEFGGQSFDDVTRQALEDKQYGFAWSEIVYDRITSGDYAGMIGWSKLAYRSQMSKWRWNVEEVDTPGGGRIRQLVSITQLAPPTYVTIDIPREKCIIWTNDQQGENFDGWSLLRSAYKPWFLKDLLMRLEAIGLERAYMGIPYAKLPEDWSDVERDVAKTVVENLRTHESAGVVLSEAIPLEILHNKLEGSPMRAAIEFQDTQIVFGGLAGFLKLGMSGRGGAYSLAQEFDYLFLLSLNAAANRFAEPLNLWPGLPLLLSYNYPNVDPAHLPRLAHGDIGQRNLDKMGRVLQALGQWGFLTPDPETEDQLRRFLDLPERDDTVTPEALRDLVEEVMPKEAEFGKVFGPAGVPPVVQVAKIGAQAKQNQLTAQSAATATARSKGQSRRIGRNPGGLAGADSDGSDSAMDMSEARKRWVRGQAQLREMVARRPWPRASIRNPEHRIRVEASYALAEGLEALHNDIRYARKPDRPSVAIAKARRPYEVIDLNRVRLAEAAQEARARATVRDVMARAKAGDLHPVHPDGLPQQHGADGPHEPAPGTQPAVVPQQKALNDAHAAAVAAFFGGPAAA